MNTLRAMAQFVGMGPPISFRAIGNYVTGRGEAISMRTVIARLQALPPITLEAEAEKISGEVPLSISVRVHPSSGIVLETRASLLRPTGEVVASWTWGDSEYAVYTVQAPGSYVFAVTRTGITNTGRTQLTKTFAVSASAKATVSTAVSRPSIAVQAKGDGSFVVSGSNFLPNATVHIRVVDAALKTLWLDQTATAQGTLQYPTGTICQLPGQLFFSANDGRSDSHDLTGTLWSNTVTTTCPG